jgi:two-component system response regulator AtoC
LTPKDLAPQFLRPPDSPPDVGAEPATPALPRGKTFWEQVAASERAILERALREHDYNRTAAARGLGLSRVGLYKKMKRHGMIGLPDASPEPGP